MAKKPPKYGFTYCNQLADNRHGTPLPVNTVGQFRRVKKLKKRWTSVCSEIAFYSVLAPNVEKSSEIMTYHIWGYFRPKQAPPNSFPAH